MIHRNLMVLSKICTSRTAFCNCVISFNNNNIFHLVNKFSFHSVQWMQYTTNFESTECSNIAENDKNQNLPICLYTEDVDSKFKDISLQNFVSRTRNSSDLYLTSCEVAKTFVDLIKNDLLKNASYVIELNPGFGFITKELLQIGIPFIDLYEGSSKYWEQLNSLSTRFPNQLNLKQMNLFNISKMLTGSSPANSKIYELIDNMHQKKWDEESSLQIIGATSRSTFIRHIILSTVFQTGFMMFGRPIFYLAIPPSMSNNLMCVNKKRTASYIMFHMLFNFKIFGTVDRKAFIPQYKIKRTNRTELEINDSYILHIVKIEPKPDLFTLFKSKRNLIFFWHFIRHNFYKPSARVIPSLEKIIPGCGVKLIAMNYNIFTRFGDLSPNQVYELFWEFQSWPEFEESSFVLSANDIRKIYHLYLEEDN